MRDHIFGATGLRVPSTNAQHNNSDHHSSSTELYLTKTNRNALRGGLKAALQDEEIPLRRCPAPAALLAAHTICLSPHLQPKGNPVVAGACRGSAGLLSAVCCISNTDDRNGGSCWPSAHSADSHAAARTATVVGLAPWSTGAAEPRSVRLPSVDALLQRVCRQ